MGWAGGSCTYTGEGGIVKKSMKIVILCLLATAILISTVTPAFAGTNQNAVEVYQRRGDGKRLVEMRGPNYYRTWVMQPGEHFAYFAGLRCGTTYTVRLMYYDWNVNAVSQTVYFSTWPWWNQFKTVYFF